MDFWAIVREFGLPLAMLAFVLTAVSSGLYVAGRELKSTVLQWQQRMVEQEKDSAERLAYTEARRVEEREGRIAAEGQLMRVTESTSVSIRAMTDLLSDIEKEILRGNAPRPPSG